MSWRLMRRPMRLRPPRAGERRTCPPAVPSERAPRGWDGPDRGRAARRSAHTSPCRPRAASAAPRPSRGRQRRALLPPHRWLPRPPAARPQQKHE
eukprot:4899603-Prymnesium_polylepis.2